MAAAASGFRAIVTTWAAFHVANVQLSRVYLVSTLDITCDKMYQTLSLISWEREPGNKARIKASVQ